MLRRAFLKLVGALSLAPSALAGRIRREPPHAIIVDDPRGAHLRNHWAVEVLRFGVVDRDGDMFMPGCVDLRDFTPSNMPVLLDCNPEKIVGRVTGLSTRGGIRSLHADLKLDTSALDSAIDYTPSVVGIMESGTPLPVDCHREITCIDYFELTAIALTEKGNSDPAIKPLSRYGLPRGITWGVKREHSQGDGRSL